MSGARHTPGPWHWFERMPGRPYLATPDRGQLYVLGFERKGMQGAGPVFSHWNGICDGAPRNRMGGIMEPGLLLLDGSMHPDARLMEAAPDLLEALQSIADCCDEDHAARDYASRQTEIRGIARAAIAKATR